MNAEARAQIIARVTVGEYLDRRQGALADVADRLLDVAPDLTKSEIVNVLETQSRIVRARELEARRLGLFPRMMCD